jgi:hypothetical protein
LRAKKTNNSHESAKSLPKFFAPAYRRQGFPSWREKKEVSAQRREDAKGFSLHLGVFVR